MQRLTTHFLRLAAVAALSMPAVARADVVVGEFNAAGSVGLTGPAFPMVMLSFTGPLIAVPTLNGIFAAIAPGTTGTIQSVTIGSGAFFIPNFLTVAGYTFSLLQVAAGSFSSAQCAAPPAPGESCSFPGSGMNYTDLANGAGGVNATLAFNFGGVVTTPAAQTFNYTGTFTSQLTGQSYQQAFAALAAGQEVPVSYSLNLLATVPSTATP